VKRALFLLAFGLLLAGCGGDDSTDATSTDTVTLPASSAGKVYWLRDGKVWPFARELPAPDTEAEALAALVAGPTDVESSDLGATTAITGGDLSVTIDGGVARVEPQGQYSREALAQIVYTLTQFPTVTSVEIGGKTYTRKSFEDQTPAILVESPLPFEEVSSPITASGTANTFEATFNYELTDTDGLIVDENFVTATSGTGTRGTFEFTTKPFTVPFDGVGSLIVFEPSAEDGSRTKLVEIPLRMSK
jgi:immunoglobulin-like protein involved in spore germination/sporulation and spore germination protein